eukprot:7965264-Alexandrium_andersonii.AAC.1
MLLNIGSGKAGPRAQAKLVTKLVDDGIDDLSGRPSPSAVSNPSADSNPLASQPTNHPVFHHGHSCTSRPSAVTGSMRPMSRGTAT